MGFKDKDGARKFFQGLTQTVKDWNRAAMDAPEFKELESRVEKAVEEVTEYA